MTRTDILTITLNPALDLGTATARVVPGQKLRCGQPTVEPGGGGVNVSRAIAQLGGVSCAAVALGGPTGERLGAALAEAGLPLLRLDAPGETRLSLAVTDAGGEQYRFVLPGPEWADDDLARAMADIAARASGWVVLSGSLPPGAPDRLPTDLAAALPGDTRLVVDTSGAPLEHLSRGAAPRPAILRMDGAEAAALALRPLPDREDSAAFARDLVAAGAAERVVIARGADGSVLAGPDGLWHASAAPVPVVSAIGAGDSFVGAMVKALAEGHDAPEALRHGAAAASAAVMTPATELCSRADFDACLPRCVLTRLGD